MVRSDCFTPSDTNIFDRVRLTRRFLHGHCPSVVCRLCAAICPRPGRATTSVIGNQSSHAAHRIDGRHHQGCRRFTHHCDRSLRALTECSPPQACDHYLAKGAGGYDGPSSRALFNLSTEVKSLLEPLRRVEETKSERLAHLEQLLVQWSEVFPPDSRGDLASPVALAKALSGQKAQLASMKEQLDDANQRAATTEQRCLTTLAEHHRAHRAELGREAMRHNEALELTRELARSKLQDAQDLHVAQLREAHYHLHEQVGRARSESVRVEV